MTDYGAIDGNQASESDHLQPRNDSLPSDKASEGLLSPWARATAALSIVLIVALSYRNSFNSKPSINLALSDEDFHDQDEAQFYDDQLVDHFNGDTSTWSNRYYKSTNYFKGPGHPIFMVVGGEGALDHGMLYPFVTQHLAPYFGAAVIQIEHRFYGPYQPITGREATVPELIELLTPQQAMADHIQLTKSFKEELNCLQYDKSSENYCPVVSVGGSYPGFLSAMFRLAYSNFIDISYASSAPLKLYDQTADQNVFYDIVTKAAERSSEGCADAVSSALQEAVEMINEASSVKEAVKSMNMCVDTVPEYITTLKTLSADVMMAIGFSFADFDMGAYPPGPDLGIYKACQVFQKEDSNSLKKVANFFQLLKADEDEEEEWGLVGDEGSCFDLSVFLPDGDNPRIPTSI
mmetsp:Transcript_24688/g.53252  ORF Transcript_24688/g.53252 Transcript_24688/m.53252 type:complete len:407 (+) Transcript_24688:170-1390(+)